MFLVSIVIQSVQSQMTVDSILSNQAQNVLIPMRWQMVKSQVFVFHFLFFIPLDPCCDLAYFIKRTILFHVINVTIALEWLSKIFITLVKRSSEILPSCGKKLILYKKVPPFINYCFKNHQMIASLLRNLLNCLRFQNKANSLHSNYFEFLECNFQQRFLILHPVLLSKWV